jgi:hypothetical protein
MPFLFFFSQRIDFNPLLELIKDVIAQPPPWKGGKGDVLYQTRNSLFTKINSEEGNIPLKSPFPRGRLRDNILY